LTTGTEGKNRRNGVHLGRTLWVWAWFRWFLLGLFQVSNLQLRLLEGYLRLAKFLLRLPEEDEQASNACLKLCLVKWHIRS